MDVSIEDRYALYELLARYTTSLDACEPEAVDGKYDLLSPGEYDCKAVRIDGTRKLKSRLVRMDVISSADRWAS